MAIILTLKHEGLLDGHDNIAIESKFHEDVSWYQIQKLFYRHLHALGYVISPDRISTSIEELIQAGEFDE